jgi:RHS repeat-associated protein
MYDPKASLMDFSARWYSPKHGRFTTEDTYPGELDMPATLHRYVGNNPVNYTDPTGNYYWCEATINGKFYSHTPPCDNPAHQVEYPDPEPINDGDPPSDGGFDEGGTGYTPPPLPIPEEIKAGKRSQLVNKVGTGTSKKSAVTKSGTNKQPTPYGYTQKKPKQLPIVKTASGSKAWSGVVSQKPTGGNRYGNVTQQFLNPKAMTAT